MSIEYSDSVAMNLIKKIQYVILLKSIFVKHYFVDVYTYLLKQPFLSNCMSRCKNNLGNLST